jgi:hypothetical protein
VGDDAVTEFERLYRAHVRAVTAFFARRSALALILSAAGE